MKRANLMVGVLVLSTSGCAIAPAQRAWNADTLIEAKPARPAERVASGDLALLSAIDLVKAPILRTAYQEGKPPLKVVAQFPSDAKAPATSMTGDDDEDDGDDEMSLTTGAGEVKSPNVTSPKTSRRSRGDGKGSSDRDEKAGSSSRSEDGLNRGEDGENPGPDFLNKAFGLTDSRCSVFGWAQGNFTGAPGLRSRTDLFGVNPNNLANTAALQQLYLVVERALDNEAEGIDFAFRLDSLFGNDWQNFHDVGLFDNAFRLNHPGYDPVQMYGEVRLPISDQQSLDVKLGRFYALAGYEEGMAPLRPLLSTGYLFSYSHPFTHTGVMTIWRVGDRLTMYNGIVNGWDRWFNPFNRWGYAGAVMLDSRDERSHLSLTLNSGPNQFHRFLAQKLNDPPNGVTRPAGLAGRVNPFYSMNNATLITLTGSHEWTDRLTTVLEGDYAFESGVPALDGSPVRSAAWGGVSSWLLYNLRDNLTGVVRAEFFNDPSGLRTQLSNIYTEETVGLIYKPQTWLWLRPELRFDQSSKNPAYNDNRSFHQFTLGFDAIILF